MNIYLLQADDENPVQRAEMLLMVEPELQEHQNEVGPGLALKAWWDQIKDTVKVTEPLERKPWGWYMFKIEDPDGEYAAGPPRIQIRIILMETRPFGAWFVVLVQKVIDWGSSSMAQTRIEYEKSHHVIM
ncbi:hypothetical protein FRC01_012797 [Tulasnella sp. 417]|nr:hypothetical protein FRC01_012797 [Tulasnella sp. 417]